MKVNKENEIDKQIADKLRRKLNSMPEQEYVAGSWENFKAVSAANSAILRRARTIRFYRYSAIGVAAILLVGLFLFISDNLSKTAIITPIAVVENPFQDIESLELVIDTPVLAVETPALDKSIKSISSKVLLANQRERARSANNKRITQTRKEVLQASESAQAINSVQLSESAQAKESSANKESEAFKNSANKEGNALANNHKEALISSNNNQIFQNDSKQLDKKPLRFGVNISPGFNSTSTNSGNSLNYSGGVTMDISIAKNLQISTGVQIEHNNVGAESQVRTMGVEPGHIDAVLTNLDIPLNITWHFFSDKNTSYYISGGFSSLAYLNEKYTTTSYSHQIKANTVAQSGDEQLTTYRIENVEIVKTTTISSPNTLDVAGRVNLIFGYEQKLSPKLNLHIEPFIKIPLTGLASENMRFTTGGVTFKVSF